MSRQIIPFPLPVYLATYFGNKLTAEPRRLRSGTFDDPFLVTSKSEFGHYLLKQLRPTNKPYQHSQVKASSFYISVSNYAGNNDPEIIVAHRHFINLPSEAVARIEGKFKAVFKSHLLLYVRGAESEGLSASENARVRTRAIRNFCEENHVIYTDKNLVAWKKMCQRNKYSPKPLIYGLL